jgi:hypothetical protein
MLPGLDLELPSETAEILVSPAMRIIDQVPMLRPMDVARRHPKLYIGSTLDETA